MKIKYGFATVTITKVNWVKSLHDEYPFYAMGVTFKNGGSDILILQSESNSSKPLGFITMKQSPENILEEFGFLLYDYKIQEDKVVSLINKGEFNLKERKQLINQFWEKKEKHLKEFYSNVLQQQESQRNI